MPTVTNTKFSKSSYFIPVTLEQLAEGLRGLSKRELETLDILLNREAMKTLQESFRQSRSGKFKKLPL